MNDTRRKVDAVALAKVLSGDAMLTQRWSDEHVWEVAHAVTDIASSCEAFLRIVGQISEGGLAAYDGLLEAGEELRHILYHVSDTRFYKYLLEE